MNVENRFIKDVDKLIPCPNIALDVLSLAHDAEVSLTDMTEKIQQDPNMTANMLRMANSSYFGHMKEISSLRDAIVRLGLDAIRMLAITSASAGILTSPQQAYSLEPRALWNHSYACAVLAGIIAEYAKIKDIYTVYTAALLHDIGKVVLNRHLIKACTAKKTDKKFSSTLAWEHFMIDTDHAKVGAALLEAWGLPDSITHPVRCHHAVENDKPNLLDVRVVQLANFLIESIGIRALIPGNFEFDIEEFLLKNEDSRDLSFCRANLSGIMEEFFSRFSSHNTMLAA